MKLISRASCSGRSLKLKSSLSPFSALVIPLTIFSDDDWLSALLMPVVASEKAVQAPSIIIVRFVFIDVGGCVFLEMIMLMRCPSCDHLAMVMFCENLDSVREAAKRRSSA